VKVSELKELVPFTDVMELDPNSRYIVRIDKRVRVEHFEEIARLLRKAKINAVLVQGDDLTFYEISH
jgi:biopolymer transport protein ExbD